MHSPLNIKSWSFYYGPALCLEDNLLWVVLSDVLYGYELKRDTKFALNICQFCTAKPVEEKYRQVSFYGGYTFLKTVAQIRLHKLNTIFPFETVSPETASAIILTLILLTWRILWAHNNASKWQMGFNSAFKELMLQKLCLFMNLLNKPVLALIGLTLLSPLRDPHKQIEPWLEPKACLQAHGNDSDPPFIHSTSFPYFL